MPTKISKEINDKIVHDLANGHNIDEIVTEVCEKTGLDWYEAKNYIDRLSIESKNKITLIQSPLLTLVALCIFLTGTGIVLSEAHQAYQAYQIAALGKPWSLYQGLFLLLMSIRVGLWNIVIGSAMIAGSLKGMEKVWEAIFDRLGKG